MLAISARGWYVVWAAIKGARDEVSTAESGSSGTAAERALLRALVAIVALAPLPLASNRPLPAALLALATGILLCIWAILAGRGQVRTPVPVSRLRWPLILFGLTVGWIFIQWLPVMPASLADPIWREAAEALGEPLSGRISVNPEATLAGLMRLLAYGAIFWLTVQLTATSRAASSAITAVALIGAAYALYGIIIYAAGNDTVLLYEKWAYRNALSSTFVNRNSYATFAGLGLLCATAAFINSFRYLLTIDRPVRQRIVLIARTVFDLRSIWKPAAAFLLMIALALTGSRAGVASGLIGLFVLFLTYLRGGALRLRHALLIGGMIAALLALVLALAGDLLVQRLGRADAELDSNSRSIVYETTLRAIGTAPWTGTGYGTYRDAFAAYRPESLSSIFYWDKAHNTYLENALELGIPAALALHLGIVLLAFQTLRGLWRRRRERTAPSLGLAATALVGIHSCFDFSLQMPAVAVLYAFILGFAVSQSWPGGRPGAGERQEPG